jgi:hypothetical protein
LGPPSDDAPAARTRQRLHEIVAAWRAERVADRTELVVATAHGRRRAVLLAARDGAHTVLGASLDDGEPTDDPDALLAVAELAASAGDASLDARTIERALGAGARWLERRSASEAIGGAAIFRAASRRSALRRIAGIAQRAPHHRKALIAPMAAQARRVVAAPFGVGAERILDAIAGAPLADEAWLRALNEFGAIHAGPPARQQTAATLIAAIVIDVQ